MAAHIARENLLLGSAALLTSFACSSARLLLTQKRLLSAQEALRREATHDGLTAVLNHAAILGVLQRELLRAERSGVPVGLMMIDVDRFKDINDSYGHSAGDQVLRTLTHELGAVLRSYDSLGRYGGEEFLVVVPGCDLVASTELAERVRAHVESRAIEIKDGSIHITISIGVAAATNLRSFRSEPLLQEADAALYRAKQSGRNRVEPIMGAEPNPVRSRPVVIRIEV
jgi:diguanylate cyclase (GGDEF)-like protein